MAETKRHTVSNADKLYRGKTFYSKYSPDGRRGVEMSHLYFWDLGAVEVADVDGICTAAGNQNVSAGPLTLDGTLVTDGVAVFTTPRNIIIDSSTTDTTQTATITGTDVYGEVLVEDIAFNSTNAVEGVKAFKTVNSVVTDITLVGDVPIGTADVLGCPVRMETLNAVIQTTAAGVVDAPTIVVAVDTTATSTTGDVRGTIKFTDSPDGSVVFAVLLKMNDTYTKLEQFGVAQYGG